MGDQRRIDKFFAKVLGQNNQILEINSPITPGKRPYITHRIISGPAAYYAQHVFSIYLAVAVEVEDADDRHAETPVALAVHGVEVHGLTIWRDKRADVIGRSINRRLKIHRRLPRGPYVCAPRHPDIGGSVPAGTYVRRPVPLAEEQQQSI